MNTLGQHFAVTSFGESHGSYVGCVIDGCPSNIEINIAQIQHQVNRRKATNQNFSTTRIEDDEIEIISGIYNQKTLGSPIAILIKNKNTQPDDYNHLQEIYRPNHADFTNEKKYGFRDVRGGGRSSIRVTAPLVAAGDIALQLLQHHIEYSCTAFVSQIGEVTMPEKFNFANINLSNIDNSVVKCPDSKISQQMIDLISKSKEEGDTLGGVITCVVKLNTVGIGEPIFNKLQAQLAHAMLSINTVKGFEYGLGFESASKKGSEFNDEFENKNNLIRTKTNRSGGIQGGISNGMDIYFRVAFKPISSIQKKQQTVNINAEEIELEIKGRHDVCAVPRAVPIVEAYTNIVIADLYLQHLKNIK